MLKKAMIAAALCAGITHAMGADVTGILNASGYAAFDITVATSATVMLASTLPAGSALDDPMVSLFDSAGAHLVTNDDADTPAFDLSQSLPAGRYSVLVSYCCSALSPLDAGGAVFQDTDGTRSGTYWFGGSTSLSEVTAHLESTSRPDLAATSYQLTLTNASVASSVPEPATVALLGAGLLVVLRLRGSQRR